MIPLTVVTPVGPHPHNKRWLGDCLLSIDRQTVKAGEHILVDDTANLNQLLECEGVRIAICEKHIGPASVNVGIETSKTDWVVILNSDDTFYPEAIEKLTKKIEGLNRPSYIRFDVNCNNNTISPAGQCFHKEIWERAGRYPNEYDLDRLFVSSILMKGLPFAEMQGGGIYWHRYHSEQLSKVGRW